jgi:hypothetical protein
VTILELRERELRETVRDLLRTQTELLEADVERLRAQLAATPTRTADSVLRDVCRAFAPDAAHDRREERPR